MYNGVAGLDCFDVGGDDGPAGGFVESEMREGRRGDASRFRFGFFWV